MAGKHSKNAGFIDLTRDEWNVVTVQKVVESFWFRDPKGWWQGPDGAGMHPILGVEMCIRDRISTRWTCPNSTLVSTR